MTVTALTVMCYHMLQLDTVDNCRLISNTDQANNDGDAFGDVCDTGAVSHLTASYMSRILPYICHKMNDAVSLM